MSPLEMEHGEGSGVGREKSGMGQRESWPAESVPTRPIGAACFRDEDTSRLCTGGLCGESVDRADGPLAD